MAGIKRVTGVRNVVSNLRKQEKVSKSRTERGLKKGGLFLQRESMPLVPVDTGNLKGSAFTRFDKSPFGSKNDVIVGYTAAYAPFVHEAPMKLKGQKRSTKGNYWDPQPRAQNKFLETPIREKKDEMFSVIKKEATRK